MTEREQVLSDARAVFLPAIDEQSIPPHIADHLSGGGISVLVGESRDEYVAREMSRGRRATETVEWLSDLTTAIRTHAGGPALVAIDQELGGIQRLHGLATALPSTEQAAAASDHEVEAVAQRLAAECSALGVNVVLSPIVDVLSGPNLWLAHRTISADAATVQRTSVAFVRGLQKSGEVAATAKSSRDEIDPTLEVFRAVSAAGVRVVMTGPALVPAIDSENAASRSAVTVDLLRNHIGFRGVIVSDDLDSPGILRGGSLEEAAIDALNAGIDWLLVAGTPHLPNLVSAVADAVDQGVVDGNRLRDAADAVRSLAVDLG